MKLEEIRNLIDKATLGPWGQQFLDQNSLIVRTIADIIDERGSGEVARCRVREDAAFIAASRALMPKLVGMAEAVKREETSKHREWDHTEGCPRCDAHHDKMAALAALEADE